MENFDLPADKRSLAGALAIAKSFSTDFPGKLDLDRNGLVFHGSVGTGKTHLAVGIARHLLKREFTCRFADHSALLRQIQATYDPASSTTAADVIEPLLRADVLILDDLGVARATEWAQETLHYILNDRYSQRAATILTTNLEDGDRRGMASDNKESRRVATIVEAVGARLYSRLHENCGFVAFQGDDWRTRQGASR